MKSQGNDNAKEQAALLGRVLDGEPLAPVGKRHAARLRVVGMVANCIPPTTPWSAVLELLRPCLTATELDAGETFDGAVEKTRRLYEGSVSWRREKDAKFAAARAATQALVDRVKGSATPLADTDPGEWEGLEDPLTEKGKVRGCEHNAKLLLSCQPDLRGTIRWNSVKKRIEVMAGPLAGTDGKEGLDRRAAGWLQRHCDFMGNATLMRGALRDVAMANAYDPIADYLNELAWDGVSRVDDFLEKYCGADVVDADRKQYVRAVSRRFLISLVARGLEPGCKVDTMLILEGDQGIGKSSALKALVGQEYFLDSKIDIGSKDALMLIGKAWLCEFAEMASMRKVDTETIKQFLTNTRDEYRPPYAVDVVESARRCCCAATVNPDGDSPYLRDPTGNRRFWAVRCSGRPDLVGIERDRDMVLAEAVAAYRAGDRWWLDDVLDADLIRLARDEAAVRTDEIVEQELVERWWYGMKPKSRPKRMTAVEVAEAALGLATKEIAQAHLTKVGRAMTKMGFTRRRSGTARRYYEASDALLSAPQQTTAMRAAGMSLVERMER